MKVILRIIIDILLFFAILNAWWLPALVLALVGVWFFRFYAEIIIVGVAYDALFGMVPGLGWKAYAGTITAAAILAAAVFLKKLVR